MTQCLHCKKEVARALEDFSGRWFCPNCLHDLFPTEDSQLKITPESSGYFVRSERLYKEGWLLKRDVFGFKGELALQEAVNQCRVAAALNDPYALVALASYYETGDADGQMSKVKRWNLSLMCNKAVALNRKSVQIEYTEGSNATLLNRAFDELKMEAGVNIMRLLKNVPSSLSSSARIENLKTNLLPRIEKLCADITGSGNVLNDSTVACEYRRLVKSHRDQSSQRSAEFGANDMISIISGMRDERPPLFFLAYLSGFEVKKLYDATVKTNKTVSFRKFCTDNNIVISAAEAINGHETNVFYDFFVNFAPNAIEDSKSYFMFVFNNKAKTKKFKKLAELRAAFIQGDQLPLRRLVSISAYNDYVFGEDDILISRDRNPRKIADHLIKTIEENV